MTKKMRSKEPYREYRIWDEAIVDAYGPEEQALGWYYYLDSKLNCPFPAKCTQRRTTSPLNVSEVVRVLGMSSEDDCMQEMFVMVEWLGRKLAVPLSQLSPIEADEETFAAVEDWLYWVEVGYEF